MVLCSGAMFPQWKSIISRRRVVSFGITALLQRGFLFIIDEFKCFEPNFWFNFREPKKGTQTVQSRARRWGEFLFDMK